MSDDERFRRWEYFCVRLALLVLTVMGAVRLVVYEGKDFLSLFRH